MTDYSRHSDDQLAASLQLVKVELNAGYGRFPLQEIERSRRLLADVQQIRAEQRRRMDSAHA